MCVLFTRLIEHGPRRDDGQKDIYTLLFFYPRSEENYYYYYYVKGKEELSERLIIHSQKQLDKQSIDKTARHLRSIVRCAVPHVDGVEKVGRDKN